MKAFIDIDTQIDFVFPAGALYTKGSERVIPVVAALNAYAVKAGIPLISTMCAHEEDSLEFNIFPPHCVTGTVGQLKPAATLAVKRAVVPNQLTDIDVAGAEQIILEKDDLDMFTNPNTRALLDLLGIDECFVYGVLTEFCVKCAIMGLLKAGRKVHLVMDGIAAHSEASGKEVVDSFVAAGGQCVVATATLGSICFP
jgi:nicotinamidase/pyrazinamidase